MEQTPLDVVMAILADPKNIQNVAALTTPDVTYVSLNQTHPDLTKVMPWCGTWHGPETIVKTFVDVGRFWRVDAFDIDDKFFSGENVAIVGRFTYTSVVLSKTVTSPFAVFAKVKDGLCYYMQFMEDTLATTASFKSGGTWQIQSDPDGHLVEI